MPSDCIAAYAVVGPMNRNPFAFSALASAVDSGDVAGIWPSAVGPARPRRVGSNCHTSAASEP